MLTNCGICPFEKMGCNKANFQCSVCAQKMCFECSQKRQIKGQILCLGCLYVPETKKGEKRKSSEKSNKTSQKKNTKKSEKKNTKKAEKKNNKKSSTKNEKKDKKTKSDQKATGIRKKQKNSILLDYEYALALTREETQNDWLLALLLSDEHSPDNDTPSNSTTRPKESEKAVCPICLEEFGKRPKQPVQMLPCGHAFHADEIKEWFKQSKKCPICR